MLAQVAGPALKQGGTHRQAQGLGHLRQIAVEQLVLQGFGRGGQEHGLAGQQGRDQVRKGLANTGAGLHHQVAAVRRQLGNRLGHGALAIAHDESRPDAGQRAVSSETCQDAVGKIVQAGWGKR